MTTKTDALIARGQKVLLGNYRQQPVVMARGEGAWVYDVEGRRYLDFICGVAVNALGHCHPEVTRAAQAQLERLWHTSNGVWTEPSIELAEQLTELSGLDRVFFCNSGAEANEALIKLARRYHSQKGQKGRYEILCFDASFHGRTLATVTATGQAKYQQGFEPLPEGFRHVPYGDLEKVEAAISERTGAILVEPVQGEGGVKPAPEGFLRGLRELCDRHGLLLLVDEIQTGMGRTGRFFGYQWDGIRPDAVSMAKALGNGLPIGAMLCTEEAGGALTPGTHGSTFGGNPVACAAANAAVRIIRDPRVLETVRENGAWLLAQAEKVRARHEGRIAQVRGKGLLFGCELTEPAGPALARCREGGLVLNLAGERTLRMAPPFIASRAQLDEALAILEQAVAG